MLLHGGVRFPLTTGKHMLGDGFVFLELPLAILGRKMLLSLHAD